ncbi:MAG: T9SS type A sorting domain-containing protein [bacterium]|nr:T9SS type A sorting domain-containing protein [bacterium]
MRRSRFMLSIFWTVVMLAILSEKSTGGAIFRVDTTGDVGKYISMVAPQSISRADLFPVFISYYDATNGNLKCAEGFEMFSIQNVDTIGDVGMWTSIGIQTVIKDSLYSPHISYYDSTNGDLKYVHWNGTQWDIEKVDTTGNVGLYTSLKLDTLNYPHISYYDATNGDLKYASWNGTQWIIEKVDTAGDVGQYSSLYKEDRYGIAYYDATNGDLKYAYRTGTQWIIGKADTAGNVGQYCSLSKVTNNYVIAYYDVTNGDLKKAVFNGSSWITSILDSVGDVGMFACCNDGMITYYDKTGGVLKWGNTSSGGGACDFGDVGGYTSCGEDGYAMDVAYYDFTNKDLKWVYTTMGMEESQNPQFTFRNAKLEILKNPFIKSTTVSYCVPDKSNISLRLYDISGSCVKTLADGEKEAGSYSVTLNAKELKTGIYFVKLSADNYKLTKKLIVMK